MNDDTPDIEDTMRRYCIIASIILLSVYALLCIYNGTVYLLRLLGLEALL